MFERWGQRAKCARWFARAAPSPRAAIARSLSDFGFRLFGFRLFAVGAACSCALLAACLSGCGSDFGHVLGNSAGAAGRTAVDRFLTDALNDLADVVDPPPADPGDDGSTEPSPTPPPGLAGVEAAGRELFAVSFCPSCHCPAATGGCSLNAPNLSGKAYETIHIRLRSTLSHPGGKYPFTDQQILDLEAFMATVPAEMKNTE